MKRIALFVALIAASVHPEAHAQSYRWDAKILIDSAGLRVFTMKVRSATINELTDRHINPHPAQTEMTGNKRAQSEKRKVAVTALVVASGKEDDGDYHLVLKSPNGGKTMIAEIPDPDQPKLQGFPGLKNTYAAARSFFRQYIDATPGSIHPLSAPVKVKIQGVVFFDKSAHGSGHAINGIEIHPILLITK